MEEKDKKQHDKVMSIGSSINLDLELIPIVEQLTEIGYNRLYVKRLLFYFHPNNVEEAINYFLREDGIIQHYFIEDQKIKENKLCFICGEKENIHLSYFPDIKNDNTLGEDYSINNNDTNFNLTEDFINEDNNIHKNLIKSQTDKIENDLIKSKNSESIKAEECSICSELYIPSHENTLILCGHSFCNNCWYNFLSLKILENKLTSIKCLYYECQEKLSDDFIINIIKPNEELIEKYKSYKLELDIINDPNKKFCPYPNCNSYAEKKDPKNKFVKCHNNHEFCFLCLGKPHEGVDCKNIADKSVEEFAKNHLIKKCPNCGIITEKIEGCNHITCSKCQYQWCWLCNGSYEPDHFYEGKCKGLEFFKPKNENDIKLALKGKKA